MDRPARCSSAAAWFGKSEQSKSPAFASGAVAAAESATTATTMEPLADRCIVRHARRTVHAVSTESIAIEATPGAMPGNIKGQADDAGDPRLGQQPSGEPITKQGSARAVRGADRPPRSSGVTTGRNWVKRPSR
jgi:hypothetical protein